VVKGLLDSNNVARYARAIDDIRGRYSNLSPWGRAAVSGWTPFGPWYVNALHFLAVTLPGHHPVKTGAIAGMYLGTQDQRKQRDVPSWAEGYVGGMDLSHYTPFGVGEGGFENATQLFAPQVSGIIANLSGRDWTGKPLPPGLSRAGVAANTMFETFTPFVARARQVREKGGTSVAGSTIFRPKTKAGTSRGTGAGLERAFNPFHKTPAAMRKQTAAGVLGLPVLEGDPSDDVLKKYGGSTALPVLDAPGG
jgi:hypothetical protein